MRPINTGYGGHGDVPLLENLAKTAGYEKGPARRPYAGPS